MKTLAVCGVLLLSMSLMAQTEIGANLPAQVIGANDLLLMSVYGMPELTRTVRVGPDGTVRLPMVQERIPAAGVMPAELESRIAHALVTSNVLVDPVVSIAISEFHSRPIQVIGSVKNPVTFQSTGRTTLLDALTRAQGLTEDAGEEILVTRQVGVEGQRESDLPPQRIPVRKLIDGETPELNLVLVGGEQIRVPPAGKVFVVGNVKRPGAFRVGDGSGVTVLKALAMAEGLAPYAAKEAYVIRKGSGASGEILVELRNILDRKSPDMTLQANDIFYVPDHRSRRVAMTAIEKAIGFATATASGALILGVNR